MDQPTHDSQALEAYMRAPQAVQDALTEGSVIDFIVALQDRYKLHVDTAGAISGMIRDTLLGLMTPESFFEELKRLGLEVPIAEQLVRDLNTEVFMPLREKMRNDPASAVPKKPEPVPPPTRPAPLPPPAIEYAPKKEEVVLPGSTVAVPQAAPAPIQPTVLEETPAPQPVQHTVHTAPTATHQPGWHPAAAVHIFVPTHGGQPAQPVVTEGPAAPQAPEPPLVETRPAPAPTPAPAPQTPPTTPPPPVAREYVADPYREPI